VVKEAQSVYPKDIDEFDSNKYLLNLKNGTLDMENCRPLYPHSSNDLITMLANVEFDRSATLPRFDEFMNQIFEGNQEVIKFVQKILGYSLTGDTRYECLFVLYGASTRNGKGTLIESVVNVLGDYAKAMNYDTLAAKTYSNPSGPKEDLARLKGTRFVSVAEPRLGLTLDVAKIK